MQPDGCMSTLSVFTARIGAGRCDSPRLPNESSAGAVVRDGRAGSAARLSWSGEQDEPRGSVTVRAKGFEQFEHPRVVGVALAGQRVADVLGQVQVADRQRVSVPV